MTDTQSLLAEYVQSGSDAAFRKLVTRYVDLVYSTALRLVGGDTHRADDVAQTVFVDLARLARTLPVDVKLGGWLHRDTCFVAATLMRGERRRQSRERQAVEMNALQNNSDADYSLVAPILDEAINELADADRTAILLRFFERHDFRAVGQALGSNEDAARMRVTRALDKLEGFLKRRGVTTTAASLGVMLSANAVQAAPIGLAVTISTAAVLTATTLTTTATATATKAIAMTILQKTIITATLAVAVGAGIYEARQASNLRDQVQSLQEQQALLAEQLQRKRDGAANRLAALLAENEQLKSKQSTTELLKLRGEVTRLRNNANDPTDATAKALVAKVNRLKQRLEETPNAKIPELQFLTEQDWLNAANGKLDTDVDYRRALAGLRSAGENKFAVILKPALSQYMRANNGQFPTDLSQLQPYFASPVEDAILERWEITSPKTVSNIGVGEDGIITEKAPVDDVFDSRIAVGSSGYGTVDFLTTLTQDLLAPVYKAFFAANSGQLPTDISQVLPYATTPEQQAAVQKMMLRNSSTR